MRLPNLILLFPLTLTLPVQAQDCDRSSEFPQILTPVPRYTPERAGPPPGVPIRSVPQEYIPAYDCVLGFFEKSAFFSIVLDYTDHLLEQSLGIALDESNASIKNEFISTTMRIQKIVDKVSEIPENVTNEEYESIEIDQIRTELERVREAYNRFLVQARDLGIDADSLHAAIVAEGRKISSIPIYPDPDSDELVEDALKPLYRRFEVPGYNNPYLE